MPRKNKKVNVYYPDGKFKHNFDSESEFSKYYGTFKNFLAQNSDYKKYGVCKINDDLDLFVRDITVTSELTAHQAIQKFLRIKKSKFVKKRLSDKDFPIDCYNVEGKLIACFDSIFTVEAFLGKQIKLYEGDLKKSYRDLTFIISKV